MGKQYAYSQHQVWSVLRCWHCPTRESAGSGGTLPEQQALTITLAIAPASPYLSVPLHFSIWSAGNILWGVAIASIIGVLSGILPAWKGASLNPVDAINSK